jgi:hypothetical protein
MQEFGDSYNKYNAAKRNQNLYDKLQTLYKEYETETDSGKRDNILKSIASIKLALEYASIFNPITGKYAVNTTLK